MYKNIVFDIGGVVVNYNPKDYLVERFYHVRTEKKIYDAVFGSEEWHLLDMGRLSWEEAVQTFMQRGAAKNVVFEMRSVLEEWTEMLTARKATVTLMRLLKKKGFNLYYLTNIAREVLEMLRGNDYWRLFDGGLASCEAGIGKPDTEFYNLFLDKCKLTAQETIFTDDRQENAAAAFSAGITGIRFKNVKSFCNMLVTYGIDI